MFCESEGNIMDDARRESFVNPAQSETPGMPGNFMRENRETPLASGGNTPDRLEKATSYKTSMYASGESDEQVIPAKRSNKGSNHRRRVWREAVRPRGTLTKPTRTGYNAG